MTTTAQMAWRLMRHCDPRDISAMTLAQKTEVAGAISSALAKYFAKAPPVSKQTHASVTLAAPVDIPNIGVTNGNNEVDSGMPFSHEQRGCTMQFQSGGDNKHNEIVSRSGFLSQFEGTTGTHTARVWGDCAPVHSRQIEAIVTAPVLDLGNGSTVTLMQTQLRSNPASHASAHDRMGWDRGFELGQPIYYSTQPGGSSHGSDVNFLLRVWPLPDRAYTLRFNMELSPDVVTHHSLTSAPIELPLSDSQFESILFPLAEAEMTSTTLWSADNKLTDRIVNRGYRAEEAARKQPFTHAPGSGHVGTPAGW